MERWRKPAIVLTVLLMLAWTIFIFVFLMLLAVPSIEGAAEVAERIRLVILGCWLLGMAVVTVTLVALGRRVFDHVPRDRRVRVSVIAYVAGVVTVALAY